MTRKQPFLRSTLTTVHTYLQLFSENCMYLIEDVMTRYCVILKKLFQYPVFSTYNLILYALEYGIRSKKSKDLYEKFELSVLELSLKPILSGFRT